MRAVTGTGACEPDPFDDDAPPRDDPDLLDELARAGVIQHGAGATPASPPALTVATALLSAGVDLERVRDLVATADHLAQQVHRRLRSDTAALGDETTSELALGLAALVCADALTTLACPGLDTAPPGPAMRLVHRRS